MLHGLKWANYNRGELKFREFQSDKESSFETTYYLFIFAKTNKILYKLSLRLNYQHLSVLIFLIELASLPTIYI